MSFTQTPQVDTPNLERLSKQGVSLDRHYANLPICTPFRAILMTGRWPYQQGLMANHMSLAQRVDMPNGQKERGTLAWAFKDAGYATAHFGKWHLGGRDARPFGFEKSIVWAGTNNHRNCRYSVDGGEYEVWEGLSNSTATTDQALEWVEQTASGERPFFVVISVNPPHGPFHDAPEEKKALYPDEDALPFHPLDVTRDFEQHRDYHALISGMDGDVGQVMDRLDELGLEESTIFAYTSDHGAMTGIDGVAYGQKRHPNDESSRIPFLIRWSGRLPAGEQVPAPTSTIDVFPTLVSLAGLSEADLGESGSYASTLPGTDLSRLLRGEPDAPRPDSVFLAHPSGEPARDYLASSCYGRLHVCRDGQGRAPPLGQLARLSGHGPSRRPAARRDAEAPLAEARSLDGRSGETLLRPMVRTCGGKGDCRVERRARSRGEWRRSAGGEIRGLRHECIEAGVTAPARTAKRGQGYGKGSGAAPRLAARHSFRNQFLIARISTCASAGIGIAERNL